MNSPAFDDEMDIESDISVIMPPKSTNFYSLVKNDEKIDTRLDPGGDDYDLAIRQQGGGMALMPGSYGALCEHTFELQSMRNALEQLRSENDNLRAERDSLKMQLELADDGD